MFVKELASSIRRSSTVPIVAWRNHRNDELLTILIYKFLWTDGDSMARRSGVVWQSSSVVYQSTCISSSLPKIAKVVNRHNQLRIVQATRVQTAWQQAQAFSIGIGSLQSHATSLQKPIVGERCVRELLNFVLFQLAFAPSVS